MKTVRCVAVLPLDDRPVNTTHLAMLAQVARCRLLLPPGRLMAPGPGAMSDRAALQRWLRMAAGEADALVVSVDQLLHGGYVPMRRTSELHSDWSDSLEVLRDIRRSRPDLPLLATAVLMRTLDADTGQTEPAYWQQYGRAFAELSRDTYRFRIGEGNAPTTSIPHELVEDWSRRRQQLHLAHLALLDLVADGVVTALAIGVEDSTPESVSTLERRSLQQQIERLGLQERARVYPGADELTAVALTRALAGEAAAVSITSDSPNALARIACYEDVPLSETIAGQMAAAAAVSASGSGDLTLAVFAGLESGADWFEANGQESGDLGHEVALGDLNRFLDVVTAACDAGRVVTVADVAHPNGACPRLVEGLVGAGLLERIGGYAGWNTAGNSVGSALAQGIATWLAGLNGRSATRAMVAHHVADAWGYQCRVRPWLEAQVAAHLVHPTDPGMTDLVTLRLRTALGELGDIGSFPWQLTAAGARLPWNRLFEVDFCLEPRKERV